MTFTFDLGEGAVVAVLVLSISVMLTFAIIHDILALPRNRSR